MTSFQKILSVVFGGIIIIAVLLFSGLIPGTSGIGGKRAVAVPLTIWGTFSEAAMSPIVSGFNNDKALETLYKISYVYKEPESFESELLNALASGTGPDIFFVNQETLLNQINKIYEWPYEYYPERTFKDSFVEEGELFLLPEGVAAVPYVIDPVVMYWNRDLFNEKSIARAPITWNEFQDNAKQMTMLDISKNIIFSGAAMGEFSNIKNAKEILVILMMQTGAKINSVSDGMLTSSWGDDEQIQNAVDFFGRFSSIRADSYSWNRALPEASEMFTAGTLAMYFGFGSELNYIKNKNPHLNFDIALVPQIGGGRVTATFGKMYGLAVAKNSVNKSAAMGAILQLTGSVYGKTFSENSVYSSARRDLVAESTANADKIVLNKAAVQAKGWLDPNTEATYTIFKNMVESISSGRSKIPQAVSEMQSKFNQVKVN